MNSYRRAFPPDAESLISYLSNKRNYERIDGAIGTSRYEKLANRVGALSGKERELFASALKETDSSLRNMSVKHVLYFASLIHKFEKPSQSLPDVARHYAYLLSLPVPSRATPQDLEKRDILLDAIGEYRTADK